MSISDQSQHPRDEDPVLDAQVITTLKELSERGGGSLLGQLAGLFSDSASERVGQLHAARRSGDMTELARVAHGLLGAADAVGATRLSQLCALIEHEGASERLLDAVERETTRTRAALEMLGAST
jgi:HPt (histidine-containing phosphotransfer) domain-containing protein